MQFERFALDKIKLGLSYAPVVLLTGARRTGKTTLVKSIADELGARYRTLDESGTRSLALADPNSFVQSEQPLVIDEVQLAPELFRAIKLAVDGDPDQRPGRFLLTGSANVLLLPKIGDSLAGRIDIVTLNPLSQGEINNRRETFIDRAFRQQGDWFDSELTRQEIITLASTGGFPQAVKLTNDHAAQNRWFENYLETIIKRDIRDISKIDAALEMPRLLQLLAARSANLLNIADVNRNLGTKEMTARRYTALLETIYLVQRVPSWTTRTGHRVRKAPKLFFTDSGVLAYLRGIRSSSEASVDYDLAIGPLIENFVVMELAKQLGWSQVDASIYHYRSAKGSEVDVILENRAGKIVAIEIKSGSAVSSQDFKAIRKLRDRIGDRFIAGIVLYAGGAAIPAGEGLLAVPIDNLWAG